MVPRGHTGQAKPSTASAHEPREATITARTALVGGGAAGIGFAIAERLAPTHRVVITGRHRRAAREGGDAGCRSGPGLAVGTLVSDIADPDAAAAAWTRSTARYGSPDVLVLNAGGPPPGRILDVDRRGLAGRRRAAAARAAAAGPSRAAGHGIARLRPAGVRDLDRGPPAPARPGRLGGAARGGHRRRQAAVARVRRATASPSTASRPAPPTPQRRREILPPGPRGPGGRPPSWTRRTRRRSRPAARHRRTRSPRRSRSWPRPTPATSTGPCSRSTEEGRRRSDGTIWPRLRPGRLPRRDQRHGPPGHRPAGRRARRRAGDASGRAGPQPDHAGDRRAAADRHVRAVPADDPARPELGHAAAPPRDGALRHLRPRAQRHRGRHGGVGGRRLHLHPAVDLAPPLQRLGRRTGRVPHHRELPPAAGARRRPAAERRPVHRRRGAGPLPGGRRHDRPARAHQHLGRTGRHRP